VNINNPAPSRITQGEVSQLEPAGFNAKNVSNGEYELNCIVAKSPKK